MDETGYIKMIVQLTVLVSFANKIWWIRINNKFLVVSGHKGSVEVAADSPANNKKHYYNCWLEYKKDYMGSL